MGSQIIISFGLGLVFTIQTFACANLAGRGTKFSGASGSLHGSGPTLKSAMLKKLDVDGAKMEAALRGSTDFKDRNDYAVALMFLGRNSEAVELLTALEKERPGEFYVAANLGTACELTGNNVEALKWINEGIRRNPSDHQNTEWLHARILEAKLAQQQDAHYFENHSVLELEPEKISEQVTVAGKTMLVEKLAEAIRYQLAERMQFVKPPDAPVASLLFDYAAIEAVMKSMESAKRILKMATEYGYPPAKVDALKNELDRRLERAAFKRYSVYGAIGCAAFALLFYLHKRGIFVISSKDLKRA